MTPKPVVATKARTMFITEFNALSSSSDASVGRRSSEVCGIALQEGLGGGSSCSCTCRFWVHLPVFWQVKSSKLSTLSGKRSAEVHTVYTFVPHM